MHLYSNATAARRGVEATFRTRRRRATAWIISLLLILLVVCLTSLTIGPVAIPLKELAHIIRAWLGGQPLDGELARHTVIVVDLRAPRVVLSAVAGAGLAIAGVVLQAVVRNVLADPYVLGVNSGASCGAALSILCGVGTGWGGFGLQTSAFAGALVAITLVLLVAKVAGHMTSTRLLMAGVAVGYALSAATSFLIFASDSAEGSRSVQFWLLGSLTLASWGPPLALACAVVGIGGTAIGYLARLLDGLTTGDELAVTVGLNPFRVRLILMVLVSLLVGVVVATVGSVGFVGLVVPHLARRLVGASHAAVVPVAAVAGAILLVTADAAARTLLSPQELPVGIITALVGTPFLLVIVRGMRAGDSQ